MLLQIQDFYVNNILNDTIFILYLVTVFVDIITGNAVALYQRRWNSKTGINGTVRHIALFTVIGLLLPIISFSTNLPVLTNGVMVYVISQYTISILENLSAMGINLGEKFSKYFEFLGSKDSYKKQESKDNNHE